MQTKDDDITSVDIDRQRDEINFPFHNVLAGLDEWKSLQKCHRSERRARGVRVQMFQEGRMRSGGWCELLGSVLARIRSNPS